MRKFLLITILISAFALTVPAFANTVDMTLTGVTDWQGANASFPTLGTLTAEAGYYQFNISGIGNTYGFCIDPAWAPQTTQQYDMRTIAEGSVYERAAYLFAQSTAANAAATQVAIWELTIPGFVYHSGVTGDISGLYNKALSLTGTDLLAFDFSAYRLVVNPLNGIPSDGTGYQDYLVRVPEPGTLILVATGLVGLATFRKRFKKA